MPAAPAAARVVRRAQSSITSNQGQSAQCARRTRSFAVQASPLTASSKKPLHNVALTRLADVWQDCPHVRVVPRIVVQGPDDLSRWKALACHADVDFAAIVSDSRQFLRDLLAAFCGSRSDGRTVLWLASMLCTIFNVFAYVSHYRREFGALSSIAREEHGISISAGELFLLNSIYELSACTSIVTRDASDEGRRPLHARTLDWPLRPLARHTVHLVHMDSTGKVLRESVTWPGMLGEMTVVKPGAFSVSLNARYLMDTESPVLDAAWLPRLVLLCTGNRLAAAITHLLGRRLWNAAIHRGWGAAYLIRHVIETCETYDQAVRALSTTPLASDAYFIVAGAAPEQGAVITRSGGRVAPQRLRAGITAGNTAPLVGYDVRAMPTGECLVQTNCDVSEADAAAMARLAAVPTLRDDDMDSYTRMRVAHAKVATCAGTHGAGAQAITPSDAARICSFSLTGERGVRVGMTLFAAVMRPYDLAEPLTAAWMSRILGPRIALPLEGAAGGRLDA